MIFQTFAIKKILKIIFISLSTRAVILTNQKLF